MERRTFIADDGVAWTVWTIYPTMAERRAGRERRPLDRNGRERRRRAQIRSVFVQDMKHGWLTFQSAHERRRLAPARDDIDELSDAELSALVAQATPFCSPRRRPDSSGTRIAE